jgi:hypothetical protein
MDNTKGMRVLEKGDPISRISEDLGAGGVGFIYGLSMQWDEPHRAYHGKNHLKHILDLIDADQSTSPEEKRRLRVTAGFQEIRLDRGRVLRTHRRIADPA